jgi:hypothetical protein
MLARASQHGLRVQEVPVSYRNRAGGKSKVSGNLRASVRAGVRIIATIGRCRLAAPRHTDGTAPIHLPVKADAP